jgi:hypothetical protein
MPATDRIHDRVINIHTIPRELIAIDLQTMEIQQWL